MDVLFMLEQGFYQEVRAVYKIVIKESRAKHYKFTWTTFQLSTKYFIAFIILNTFQLVSKICLDNVSDGLCCRTEYWNVEKAGTLVLGTIMSCTQYNTEYSAFQW